MLSRLSIAVFVLFLSAEPYAQPHPNISGTWILEKSDSTGDGVTPSSIVILESPQTVTIEYRLGEEISRLTYTFKAPADVLPPEEPGATTVGDATARWVNDELETFAILTINGKTVTQKSRWTLDSSRGALTVVKDLMVHHGYEGLQANSTATEVYRQKLQ
jgi:hypothetical protein